ncbi:MAG: hypothetical protein FIA94_10125 [Nitrospirae bacterium]|nr:hypothetical protein [Nitrospirota bacterium]
MKHFGRIFGISLMALFAVMILSPASFAGSGSAEVPPGSQPYGIAMHGDAKGVKLYGTISIEYIGNTTACPSSACAVNSKIVLQLQTANGNLIDTFYHEIPLLPLDAAGQSVALLDAFRTDILDTFFGGENMNIVLVSLGEFQITPSVYANPNYMMAQITLAVN